jgi:hypothetical protein
MERPSWIKAGNYAINGGFVVWIDTAATWMSDPDPVIPKPAGELPHDPVRRTGVEVTMMGYDRPPLRFPDGSAEAEELKRFVQSQKP